MEVVQRLVPYARSGDDNGVRRVSVNSFGYAGTNAHVVLEDAQHYLESKGLSGVHFTTRRRVSRKAAAEAADASLHKHERLLVGFSAQDKDGLRRVRQSLATHLQRKMADLSDEEQHQYFIDLAYTLNHRRTAHQWKTFSIASSLGDLLRTIDSDEKEFEHISSKTPRIGFVFTGQGAQWAGMGMELMSYSEFRSSIRAADKFLKTQLGCSWSAEEELLRPKNESCLGAAEFSQTLCTVLQVALVDLLAEWRIKPVAVIGHSSGEMAAAYCAGALSRQDAWKVAYYRGKLSSSLRNVAQDQKGAMMAVGVSSEKAEEFIDQYVGGGRLVVACINSPSSVTLSGDADAVDSLCEALGQQDIFARKLQVDTAYHSHHMVAVAADYMASISDIEVMAHASEPDISMFSSCTGSLVSPEELGPAYWVRNLVSPVRFAEAVQDIVRPRSTTKDGISSNKRASENNVDLLVEIGPHSALRGPALQSIASLHAPGLDNIPYLSALVRNESSTKTSLRLAGELFARAVPINFAKINVGTRDTKVLIDVPKYPWNHTRRYWAETRYSREYRLQKSPCQPLVGTRAPATVAGEHLWRSYMRLSEQPWIGDHVVQGSILYPGAGFLVMAIEAAFQLAEGSDDLKNSENEDIKGFRLRDVQLVAPMIVPSEEDKEVEFSIILRPHLSSTMDTASTWTEFAISSCVAPATSLQLNCLGQILVEHSTAASAAAKQEDAFLNDKIRSKAREVADQCRVPTQVDNFYRHLTSLGLSYGPAFTNLTAIKSRPGLSSCTVTVPDVGLDDVPREMRPHVVHPALLDAVFHAAFAALDGGNGKNGRLTTPMVPRSINEVQVRMNIPWAAGSELKGFCEATRRGRGEAMADFSFLSNYEDHEALEPVLEIHGMSLAAVAGGDATMLEDKVVEKNICSKMLWRPALNMLLQPEKQLQQVLMTAFPCAENDLKKSLEREVGELVTLAHYTNPATSFVEIAAVGSGLGQLVLPRLEMDDWVLATASYTICCADSDAAAALQEDPRFAELEAKIPSVRVVHIGDETSKEQLRGKADFMLLSNTLLSTVGGLEMVKAFMEKISDAKLCFVVDRSEEDEVRSLIRGLGWLEPLLVLEDSEQIAFVFSTSSELQVNGINSTDTCTTKETVFLLCADGANPTAHAVATELSKEIVAQDHRLDVSTVTWSEVSGLKDKKVISLIDLGRETGSILADLQEADFDRFKGLVLESESLLWVADAGRDQRKGNEAAIATSAMVSGLVRVVRNEIPGVQLATLTVEDHDKVGSNIAALIAKVLISLNKNGSNLATTDNEFLIRDGILHVSRAVEDNNGPVSLNRDLHRLSHQDTADLSHVAIAQLDHPVTMGIGVPGMMDSVRFEPAERLISTNLDPDQVEIKVVASALNFREVMAIMGIIPDKDFGFEAAGVVCQVGSAVPSQDFQLGDRVVMMAQSAAHATVCRSSACMTMKIPEGMSFEDAAAIPVVGATAWYGLVHLARLRRNQTVLIHAGAGGVGQAAIQLARHIGAEVYTTVGDVAKRAIVREKYGIPDDHIFYSRDLSFSKAIRRATNRRGVDVVLNSLAGEALHASWHCLAPDGHFIEIGLKDVLANTRLDMRPFANSSASFSFFNLKLILQNSTLTRTIMRGMAEYVHSGILQAPYPVNVYPASQAEKALRLLQAGKHKGKLVLQYRDDVVLSVLPRPPLASWRLDSSAAYVLVGGLGGLGRSLASMLADLGARKICFLSRSGASSTTAPASVGQLLNSLEQRGVEVEAYPCNIADRSSLDAALERCRTELGPIKGVVQCAMVLQDVLFASMTYSQWTQSTRPKVQGTANLYRALADDHLDFFTVLSSFAGVFGNRGQANYAAGCAFQDQIALQSREGHGNVVTTIDLGIMRDVGVLAEQGAQGDVRDWEAAWGIREAEFQHLMLLCMAQGKAVDAQVLTGMATGGSARAAGLTRMPYYLDDDVRFSILARSGLQGRNKGGDDDDVSTSLKAALEQAESLAEAAGYVAEALVQRMARMLQMSAEELDRERALNSFGIDSLAAIEIVNWGLKEVASRFAVFDVMASVPITTFASKVATKSAWLPSVLVETGEVGTLHD